MKVDCAAASSVMRSFGANNSPVVNAPNLPENIGAWGAHRNVPDKIVPANAGLARNVPSGTDWSNRGVGVARNAPAHMVPANAGVGVARNAPAHMVPADAGVGIARSISAPTVYKAPDAPQGSSSFNSSF